MGGWQFHSALAEVCGSVHEVSRQVDGGVGVIVCMGAWVGGRV